MSCPSFELFPLFPVFGFFLLLVFIRHGWCRPPPPLQPPAPLSGSSPAPAAAAANRGLSRSLTHGFPFPGSQRWRAAALFMYFGCAGSSLLRRLSLVAVSGSYSSLRCTGFSLWWLLLLQNMGFRHMGFSNCGTWAQ